MAKAKSKSRALTVPKRSKIDPEALFDKSYDTRLQSAVDAALPTLEKDMEDAYKRAIQTLVLRAWEDGAAWAARYPMTEHQRELVAGDAIIVGTMK